MSARGVGPDNARSIRPPFQSSVLSFLAADYGDAELQRHSRGRRPGAR